MAKTVEHFRNSDVTLWATIALGCGALAVIGASISALVPNDVLAGLHASRLGGATVSQLRRDVAQLKTDAGNLARENGILQTRFALQERASATTTQRIGAIEVTLPALAERLPEGSGIDRGAVTASIPLPLGELIATDGGSMRVDQQPMPRALQASFVEVLKFGVALGPSVESEQATASWRTYTDRLGPLLLGLSPVLSNDAQGTEARIVAGPIDGLEAAANLCTQVDRVGIACIPVPFTGLPISR